MCGMKDLAPSGSGCERERENREAGEANPAVPASAAPTFDEPWDEAEDGPNPDDLTPAEYWQDIADDIVFERWREEHHS